MIPEPYRTQMREALERGRRIALWRDVGHLPGYHANQKSYLQEIELERSARKRLWKRLKRSGGPVAGMPPEFPRQLKSNVGL
ncbi:hypothetical protein [Poriferisphaera sp. WC338]|uniref:hypothetical protein n=1 Tax=Poriferisphaera sp. WC338 TaxID=3425129 RepID=UPI003D812C21